MNPNKLPADALRSLPEEFDLRAPGMGFTMRGWEFMREHLADAVNDHRMLNPAFELAWNVCPWNCEFCFTESIENRMGHKRRLKDEMSLAERLSLVDQAAELGARTINWVGAGEPTTDPDFWKLIERINYHGIIPIIYSEGALRLTRRDFVKRLYDAEATVVLKVNSLANAEYQNAIVRGAGSNPLADRYNEMRDKALALLLEEGFASSEPTRLAFDTIITRENLGEIKSLHRFARASNIFVLFVNYLPSGRSSDGISNALTREEQFAVFEDLARIDREEFGIAHRSIFPYAGGVPCSIRGAGLFVKITGDAFDCPGELLALGNTRRESLRGVWERAKPITRTFDGGCAPREEFWRTHASVQHTRSLTVLNSSVTCQQTHSTGDANL